MSNRICIACVIVSCSLSHAAERIWIRAAGGAWTTSSNWQGGLIPNGNDDAVFAIGGNYSVNLVGGRTVSSFSVRGGAVTFTGGQLDVLSSAIINQFAGGVGNGAEMKLSGATFSLNTFHVGYEGGGYGGLLVDGPTSLLRSQCWVGYLPNSTGLLVIQAGGRVIASSRTAGVSFDGWCGIGGYSNAQGEVIVTGKDSLLRAPALITMGGVWFMDSESRGKLTVEQGGRVDGGGLNVEGHGTNGGADIIVRGAGTTMSFVNGVYLGNTKSSFNLIDAATLECSNLSIGWRSFTTTSVFIAGGKGTAATVDAGVVVGDGGKGSFYISDRATLTAAHLVVGNDQGSDGVLALASESIGRFAGDATIGRQGNGTLVVSADSEFKLNGAMSVGAEAGSTGRATFENGNESIRYFGGPWMIGSRGRGRIEVAGSSSIGNVGSRNVPGEIVCGDFGHGELIVRDGASIQTDNLRIARNASSSAVCTVDGPGTSAYFGSCTVGGEAGLAGGAGFLNMDNGAFARVSSTLTIAPGSVVNAARGTLAVGQNFSTDRLGMSRGVLLAGGGEITGGGAVGGPVWATAGVLHPNAAGSPLQVTREVIVAGSNGPLRIGNRPIFQFDLVGLNQSTQLACMSISGSGGELRVAASSGVVLDKGQDYKLISTANPPRLRLGSPFAKIQLPTVTFGSDNKWIWIWVKSEAGGITAKVRAAGDFNCDGAVNDQDQLDFVSAVQASDITTDLDVNGRLDSADLSLFASLVANSRSGNTPNISRKSTSSGVR